MRQSSPKHTVKNAMVLYQKKVKVSLWLLTLSIFFVNRYRIWKRSLQNRNSRSKIFTKKWKKFDVVSGRFDVLRFKKTSRGKMQLFKESAKRIN